MFDICYIAQQDGTASRKEENSSEQHRNQPGDRRHHLARARFSIGSLASCTRVVFTAIRHDGTTSAFLLVVALDFHIDHDNKYYCKGLCCSCPRKLLYNTEYDNGCAWFCGLNLLLDIPKAVCSVPLRATRCDNYCYLYKDAKKVLFPAWFPLRHPLVLF